ncbi:mechanosensitive ion channel family protein [Fuerstiella marisgermanici]|uniref:Small-conductance mechanosensitive channel n=1 Tax=Fuerstiella marisgermanici TaxID=1891926 RepID=A0A1P8WAT0_9PLAN|nr:mechanosensitive ion channel domain-containing protein [Fuerstiella marisgermanici]APZ91144.1 Small-conductance mechanosensitive channel [Fuerstiella marisgermanici]
MDILRGAIVAQAAAETEAGGVQSVLSSSMDWILSHISFPWLVAQVATYGPKLLGAIVVFVVGRWLARVVAAGIVRGARKARVDETLVGFLNNLIYMLLLIAVCIASLKQLGVDVTSLTAVLAAAGFAIGMAMQGSLGNIAAGVMLVFFKPFRVGDVVEVGGSKGTVVEIQIFNTILLTLDNVRIIVPNGKITEGTIENYSAERERRIDLVIGCGYNDDLKAVKAMLLEVVESDERVLKSPAPVVAVAELGSSSVNFVVRPWVASREYWNVRFALTEKIKLEMDERGFTIPFPSQDLFIHNPDAATVSQPVISARAA